MDQINEQLLMIGEDHKNDCSKLTMLSNMISIYASYQFLQKPRRAVHFDSRLSQDPINQSLYVPRVSSAQSITSRFDSFICDHTFSTTDSDFSHTKSFAFNESKKWYSNNKICKSYLRHSSRI